MAGVSHQHLLERWQTLARASGHPLVSDEWGHRLIAAWTEPHRHYHNLDHLSECLELLDEARHLCASPLSVEWAIWFHDAVYDPRATDNEEQSARLALEYLSQMGSPQPVIEQVESLILATKSHEAPDTGDTTLLLDIDLAILGSNRERFARYEDDVRREFEWVPSDVFSSKRSAILRGFLARPKIYRTEAFRVRLEARARINLEWSIARLGAPRITGPCL